jgi:Zn-dependent peptidase ImmA (M78 family)
MRVEVKGELLRWARERSRVPEEALAKRFPKLADWESEALHPTMKQLETFAKATHTPVGFLFLDKPPVETVPIPDLRTVRSKGVRRPSPDLLDTIYACQQRQEWYRTFARSMRQEPLPFVGSAGLEARIESTATKIRHALGFDLEERRQIRTWTEALRLFIGQADDLGVLVMVSGIVGSSTRRRLDPDEFRGFALADDLAPVVFINGADSKAAQMFTLAHELAHIWLGESALSDVEPVSTTSDEIEDWCNRVAAELLVPLSALRQQYRPGADLQDETTRLARWFKVSTLVILRRIHDAGGITERQLWAAYRSEIERLQDVSRSSGGNFYLSQAARVSKRFARAIVVSTWEGQSSFTEAFRLLGVKKMATFRGLSATLGIDVG